MQLPALPAATTVDPRLTARAAATRAAAPFLLTPILAPWPDRPLLLLDRDQPWLLLPAEQDPLRTLKGQAVIPAQPLTQLARVLDAGVDFDRVAIAHELAPDRLPASVRAKIPPPGLPCSSEAAAHLVGPLPAPARATAAATGMDTLTRKLTGAATAGAVSLGSVLGGVLDPIVFGVLGPTGSPAPGQCAAWFPLAAWRW